MATEGLAGLKVLLLEDEALVAMLEEAMLEDLGCEVVGPAMRVAQAVELVRSGVPMDVAVLDMNVHGAHAFPAAEALRERGVPFVFASGYGQVGTPDAWRDVPVLQKPFSRDQLAEALAAAVGR